MRGVPLLIYFIGVWRTCSVFWSYSLPLPGSSPTHMPFPSHLTLGPLSPIKASLWHLNILSCVAFPWSIWLTTGYIKRKLTLSLPVASSCQHTRRPQRAPLSPPSCKDTIGRHPLGWGTSLTKEWIWQPSDVQPQADWEMSVVGETPHLNCFNKLIWLEWVPFKPLWQKLLSITAVLGDGRNHGRQSLVWGIPVTGPLKGYFRFWPVWLLWFAPWFTGWVICPTSHSHPQVRFHQRAMHRDRRTKLRSHNESF